jgi:hypothetical protein
MWTWLSGRLKIFAIAVQFSIASSRTESWSSPASWLNSRKISDVTNSGSTTAASSCTTPDAPSTTTFTDRYRHSSAAYP